MVDEAFGGDAELQEAWDWKPAVLRQRAPSSDLRWLSRPFQRYFRNELFSALPNDVQGKGGVGIVRGPGINNWDLALGKTFRFWENIRAEFRAEMSNAFNRTQWSNIDMEYDDAPGSTFGWITGARDGRFTQFVLRVMF